MQEITSDYLRQIIKKRQIDAYKNQFGHALIVAGSKGKIGAGILASKACLRSGVGLLTISCPSGAAPIFYSAIPEVMVFEDDNAQFSTFIPNNECFSAYGIGPGLGTHEATISALYAFLKSNNKPLVLDADAINAIAQKPELRKFLKNCVLTPHIGEAKRLIGTWTEDNEAIEKIIHFGKETQSIVVLKGQQTKIIVPDGKVFINTTGNPGMAKAGSGDVLTGIITAFLAQGYSSVNAAVIGVYLHGLAADLAVEKGSNYSLLASDICDFLPLAFRSVLQE
jgi:NAD(P)H-hydrate epimerase